MVGRLTAPEPKRPRGKGGGRSKMDVLIGVRATGETIAFDDVPGERFPSFVAEVFTPGQWRAGKFDDPLYASPPRLGLNAVANAVKWAKDRGYRVLSGEAAGIAAGEGAR